MKLEEKLIEFFAHYKKQFTIEELMKDLKISHKDTELLVNTLYELEKKGIIFNDNNKCYMHVPDEFCYYHGVLTKSNSDKYYVKLKDKSTVQINDIKNAHEGDVVFVSKLEQDSKHSKHFIGEIVRVVKKEHVNIESYIIKEKLKKDGNHFYVVVDEKRVYISKYSLNHAFVDDVVSVRITGDKGCVIEVIEPSLKEHVFRCTVHNGVKKWEPISSSYGFYDCDGLKYKEGDIVYANVLGDKLNITCTLGKIDSLQDEINALIMDYGFNNIFSETVLSEAKKIVKSSMEDDRGNRRDLRWLETFTIDPVNAKDLDDAISLLYDDKGYHLYVHAANPSHYIKMDSPIFHEALKRGFSVYPTNQVIPMLPDVISSGICSLNENGDKFAITCKIDFDVNGKIVNREIFKSIIHSDKQMNYDAVNEFFEDFHTHPEYLPFKDTLLKMKELSNFLQDEKNKRGVITIDSVESNFVIDENGNIVGINNEQSGDAELIIENFMLLANEEVANFAMNLELPYIYRNHEKPTVQRKNNFKEELKKCGYVFQKMGNIDNPKILQRFINDLGKDKSNEEKKAIQKLVLRTMTRAFYDTENIGHYGLVLSCYGTFTSPARKTSDLLNHMVLEEFLDYGVNTKMEEKYREFNQEICEYISEKQKKADSLEQEINTLLLHKYIEDFIDKEVKARILYINKYGIYIKDEHELTGVIPLTKGMDYKNNCIMINGCEYKPQEQIDVILKEEIGNELNYKLASVKVKKKTKKRNDVIQDETV